MLKYSYYELYLKHGRKYRKKYRKKMKEKIKKLFGVSCHLCGFISFSDRVFCLHSIKEHPKSKNENRLKSESLWSYTLKNPEEFIYCCQNCHVLLHDGIVPNLQKDT